MPPAHWYWSPIMADRSSVNNNKERNDESKALVELQELIGDLPSYFPRISKQQQRVFLEFLKGWSRQHLRTHSRKPCSIPVVFAIKDRKFTSMIKNISAGGVFIEKANGVSVGTTAAMTFWFPNLQKPSKIKGKVIWKDPLGYGIQFVISKKIERAMQKAVEQF
jgi:Tfp pilus assembly protein PilZ